MPIRELIRIAASPLLPAVPEPGPQDPNGKIREFANRRAAARAALGRRESR